MDLAIARQAGELAAKRDQVAALLDNISNALVAAAPILKIEGALQHDGGGNRVSVLPFGPAGEVMSAELWRIAQAEYTKILGDLDKEIAKLDGPAATP